MSGSATDKSLVAAQKVLAPMRYGKAGGFSPERAVKDAERKLALRMIHSTKSPVAGYEMTVTFNLNGIGSFGGKYSAKATFTFLSGKDTLKDYDTAEVAKKKFLEVLPKDLKNIQTTMFKEFWKRVEITHVAGENKPSSKDDVKQKFRQWIIGELTNKDSQTYRNFPKAVKLMPR